jgi:hypothetical protein
MDKRASPGDFILDRYNQQGSSKAAGACEGGWKISRFLKSDVEQRMADA